MVPLVLGNSVLANLVEQSAIADIQESRGPLAVPIGFCQGLRDRLGLSFNFKAAYQELQVPILFLTIFEHVRDGGPGRAWGEEPPVVH